MVAAVTVKNHITPPPLFLCRNHKMSFKAWVLKSLPLGGLYFKDWRCKALYPRGLWVERVQTLGADRDCTWNRMAGDWCSDNNRREKMVWPSCVAVPRLWDRDDKMELNVRHWWELWTPRPLKSIKSRLRPGCMCTRYCGFNNGSGLHGGVWYGRISHYSDVICNPL